jgi:hypothetical protein
MARAYNQDLRDRVIDAALGGMPARRAGGPIRVRERHGDCVGAPGARVVSGRRAAGAGRAAPSSTRSATSCSVWSNRPGHDDRRDAIEACHRSAASRRRRAAA